MLEKLKPAPNWATCWFNMKPNIQIIKRLELPVLCLACYSSLSALPEHSKAAERSFPWNLPSEASSHRGCRPACWRWRRDTLALTMTEASRVWPCLPSCPKRICRVLSAVTSSLILSCCHAATASAGPACRTSGIARFSGPVQFAGGEPRESSIPATWLWGTCARPSFRPRTWDVRRRRRRRAHSTANSWSFSAWMTSSPSAWCAKPRECTRVTSALPQMRPLWTVRYCSDRGALCCTALLLHCVCKEGKKSLLQKGFGVVAWENVVNQVVSQCALRAEAFQQHLAASHLRFVPFELQRSWNKSTCTCVWLSTRTLVFQTHVLEPENLVFGSSSRGSTCSKAL